MEPILIYLLKSAGLLALFYVCYKVLLSKETFFVPNRHFLLAGVAVSFLMPLWYLTKKIIAEPLVVNFSTSEVNFSQSAIPVSAPFNWWQMLTILYGLGLLFFLGRFCIQLLSLKKLIRSGRLTKTNGFIIVEADYDTSPFSFFNYIVYNPKLHRVDELQTIRAHEKVHARQKHSVDMLVMHLLCIVQWFNPFAWWYKKTSAQNLEYIADAVLTQNLKCKKDYQYLLLNQSTNTKQQLTIINPFFNSLIKKRIVMINQQKSKPLSAIKYTLVLPFLMLFLVTINTKTVAQTKVDNDTIMIRTKVYRQVNKNTTKEELKKEEGFFKKKYDINLRFYAIERNSKNEITGIKSNFKDFMGNSGTWGSKGDKPIKPFYFAIELDENDKVTGASYESTKWADGLSLADKIAIQEKEEEIIAEQPIIAQESTADQIFNEQTSDKPGNEETNFTITQVRIDDIKPLFIIDGKEQVGFDQRSLDPDNIENIIIWKDDLAIEKYGIKGKNGVIEIETKKAKE